MKIPSLVELDAATRTLHVRWPYGPGQRSAYRALRDPCRCAHCRRFRLNEATPRAVEQIAEVAEVLVTAVRPMGYGVQLVFRDGHDRGISPWIYLADLPSNTTRSTFNTSSPIRATAP